MSSAAGKSPFTNRRAISMLRSDHHFPRDEKYSAAYPSINDGSVPERNPAIVASRRSFESEPSVVADARQPPWSRHRESTPRRGRTPFDR